MIKEWLIRLKGGLINMLLRGEDRFNLTDSEITARMAEEIEKWFDIFEGRANWLDKKIKPVGLAVFSTAYLAKLINAELKMEVTGSARADYINDCLRKYLIPKVNVYTQLAAVGGQVILKPFVTDIGIVIESIKANRFCPMKIDPAGKITSAIFYEHKTVGKQTVVRAELHELSGTQYVVKNKAFRLEGNTIGKEIPLEDISGWENIQPEVTMQGIKAPLFACLQMPNANNIDSDSKLPISIYANAITSLEEVDRIYAGYCWELHSGRRKIFADEMAFERDSATGKTIYPEADLYIGLNPRVGSGDSGKLFEDYTPQIREQDYQNGINQQIRMYEAQIGVSAGTFSFDVRNGAMTATQVISEDRATYYMVGGIQEAWKSAYDDLAYAIDAYATLYNLAPSGAYSLNVEFGDSVFEDTGTEFERRLRLVAAGIDRPEEMRMWYHGEDKNTALENLPEMTGLVGV